MLDDVFVFFCRSVLRIEALTGYENMTRHGNIPGYGRPGIETCRNPGYGIFPGFRNYPEYGNYPGYGS